MYRHSAGDGSDLSGTRRDLAKSTRPAASLVNSETTLAAMLSRNRSREIVHHAIKDVHDAEQQVQVRKRRRIGQSDDNNQNTAQGTSCESDYSSFVARRQGEPDNMHILSGAPSSLNQGHHWPDMVASASAAGGFPTTNRPPYMPYHHNMLQRGRNVQTLTDSEGISSKINREVALAQSLRLADAQGRSFLGVNYLQPLGTDGSVNAGRCNGDLAVSAFLTRNHGFARELASVRHFNSSLLHGHHGNTAAPAELLHSQLSSLASHNNTSASSLLLGGSRARSSSLATDHFLQQEANVFHREAAADAAMYRRVAELGMYRSSMGSRLSISAPNFFSDDHKSFLMSSLINSGALSESSLFEGVNFGVAGVGLQPTTLGGLRRYPDASFRPSESVSASDTSIAPLSKRSNTPRETNYARQKKVLNGSAKDNLDAFSIIVPTRKLIPGEFVEDAPPLPSCLECPIPHYTKRTCVPLATNEDENWLSEFLCFIRSELVEVFRASHDDVASRINSKKVVFEQVGIRCRYCAHLTHNERSSRSSSFPSSIDRIYQSLTMMIRDHFVRCPGLPMPLKSRFLELKSRTTQGATDSKKYWVDSAKRLGMVDTDQGILINLETQAAALVSLGSPTKTDSRAKATESSTFGTYTPNRMIVMNDDKPLVSEYIYFLMTQVEKVSLTASEQVGNRKSMELGMPGFGCTHCCASDRKGLCRFFPARRRTLPAKISDLADHLRRCTMCPMEVKEKLADFKKKNIDLEPTEERNKHFFDRVWARLHTIEKSD